MILKIPQEFDIRAGTNPTVQVLSLCRGYYYVKIENQMQAKAWLEAFPTFEEADEKECQLLGF